MVLRLAFAVLLAGCSQSLFDQHPGLTGSNGSNGSNGSGGDGGLPDSCPAPCLASGGGDFGMAGKGWRYLEDTRNRTWVPMMMTGTSEVGTDDPNNKIDSCANNMTAPACAQLPDALLVSSSGSTSMADPAIEWTASANQTVAIELGAFVPSSASPQNILLYRNAREDVLVTVEAMPGVRASGSIVLDALAGDRFLVAVAPVAGGAADVGVQFFASQGAGTFPQQCQLALEFPSAGATTPNACGSPFTGMIDDGMGGDTPHNITLGAGPFAELGSAASFTANDFMVGADIIDRSNDTTTQFWVQQGALVPDEGSWVFSDEDLNDPNTGGLGFDIYENAAGTGMALDVATCTNPDAANLTFAIATSTYPMDGAWHFVRAVSTNNMLFVCIDGKMTSSVAVPPGNLKTAFPPYNGKNVVWTPSGAFFNGALDDIRSIKTALPCGP
jgi:hypothetical protein